MHNDEYFWFSGRRRPGHAKNDGKFKLSGCTSVSLPLILVVVVVVVVVQATVLDINAWYRRLCKYRWG